jgi:hypothetical protein
MMNENELNRLEHRLRSWRPRRPSPALEWRLFGVPARLAAQTARLVGWLAPAVACVWVTFLCLNSGNAVFRPEPEMPPALIISSNENNPLGASAFTEWGQNAPRPAILKWTNSGNSPFLNDFKSLRKSTN